MGCGEDKIEVGKRVVSDSKTDGDKGYCDGGGGENLGELVFSSAMNRLVRVYAFLEIVLLLHFVYHKQKHKSLQLPWKGNDKKILHYTHTGYVL